MYAGKSAADRQIHGEIKGSPGMQRKDWAAHNSMEKGDNSMEASRQMDGQPPMNAWTD